MYKCDVSSLLHRNFVLKCETVSEQMPQKKERLKQSQSVIVKTEKDM